jgi:hypothetical protein
MQRTEQNYPIRRHYRLFWVKHKLCLVIGGESAAFPDCFQGRFAAAGDGILSRAIITCVPSDNLT